MQTSAAYIALLLPLMLSFAVGCYCFVFGVFVPDALQVLLCVCHLNYLTASFASQRVYVCDNYKLIASSFVSYCAAVRVVCTYQMCTRTMLPTQCDVFAWEMGKLLRN